MEIAQVKEKESHTAFLIYGLTFSRQTTNLFRMVYIVAKESLSYKKHSCLITLQDHNGTKVSNIHISDLAFSGHGMFGKV